MTVAENFHSLFEITLSNGVRERIKVQLLSDKYTQVTLWSLLDEEIHRRHPEFDAAIVAVNPTPA